MSLPYMAAESSTSVGIPLELALQRGVEVGVAEAPGLLVQLEPLSLELLNHPLGQLLPRHEPTYSIAAKRLPSLLLLPRLAPAPPSKRIRRLCTGWPCH